MKKIFTLIGLVTLPLLSFAFPVDSKQIERVGSKITPEIENHMRSLAQDVEFIQDTKDASTRKDVKQRIYNDGKFEYRLVIANTGYKLTDWWYFKEQGKDLTFEDLPFYIVEYNLAKYNNEGKLVDRADCLISWPGYKMWDITNPDSKTNYDMVPIEELANRGDDGFCNTFAHWDENNVLYLLEDKKLVCYSMWSNKWGLKQVCEGEEAVFADPSASRMSQFSLISYDKEENWLYSANQFFFLYGVNKNIPGQMQLNFDGEIRLQGFHPQNYVWDVTAVHLFNAGYKDPMLIPASEDPYDFDWEPKQKFWIYASTANNHVAMDEGLKAFTPHKIFFSWNDDVPVSERINENYYSFYGPLYAPASAVEDPRGVYKMAKPEEVWHEEYELMLQKVVPTDYSMIPRGVGTDYLWSDTDGFKCLYKSYYQNLRHPGYLAFGTTDGLILRGKDNYGNTLSATYTGKIIYHYDPEDISKSREIDAVGEINSVESVAADNNIVVTAAGKTLYVKCNVATGVEVYSLNGMSVAKNAGAEGQTLAFELEKGMYLVKAGAKTYKIAM